MFPQPIPGSRERQSASRSAPRGILGGDVAGLGSLGGFPEPGTPGGELGLAGARARDQGRAWGGPAGVGMGTRQAPLGRLCVTVYGCVTVCVCVYDSVNFCVTLYG